jgi:hypothetical protein
MHSPRILLLPRVCFTTALHCRRSYSTMLMQWVQGVRRRLGLPCSDAAAAAGAGTCTPDSSSSESDSEDDSPVSPPESRAIHRIVNYRSPGSYKVYTYACACAVCSVQCACACAVCSVRVRVQRVRVQCAV